MNLRTSLFVAALMASTAVITAQVVSQEKTQKPGKEVQQTPPEGMPEWMKYTTPGEHHALLEPFSGKWTYAIQMWEYPGAEPMKTDGAIEYKWILDGRYLLGHYTGEYMDMPFEGFDVMGYDNFRGEYISLWMDNHSTAFTQSSGEFDAASKTFLHRGKHDNIMTGQKNMPFKTATRLEGKDKFVMEWMGTADDGTMFKGMELIATRQP